MCVNEAIACTLKELRKQHHLSQEKLADAIDSHQVYISEIESGKKQPSVSVLYNIASCYHMSLTELVALIEKNISQEK